MSLGAWSRNHGSLDGFIDAIISLESWEIKGCWFDQIVRFLHLWHQCTWDRSSNHRIVGFVGKSAKGTMKQLSSENYDLSGSRCFRQISHVIRNLALTKQVESTCHLLNGCHQDPEARESICTFRACIKDIGRCIEQMTCALWTNVRRCKKQMTCALVILGVCRLSLMSSATSIIC